jgi:hypothetical protein
MRVVVLLTDGRVDSYQAHEVRPRGRERSSSGSSGSGSGSNSGSSGSTARLRCLSAWRTAS